MLLPLILISQYCQSFLLPASLPFRHHTRFLVFCLQDFLGTLCTVSHHHIIFLTLPYTYFTLGHASSTFLSSLYHPVTFPFCDLLRLGITVNSFVTPVRFLSTSYFAMAYPLIWLPFSYISFFFSEFLNLGISTHKAFLHSPLASFVRFFFYVEFRFETSMRLFTFLSSFQSHYTSFS